MISASLFLSTCVSLDLWGSGMIWICSTQNTCEKLDGKQKCTNTFELNLWDQMQMWWCECKTVEARVQMRLRCAPVCQHVRRDRLLFDFRPSRPERVELLHTCLRKKSVCGNAKSYCLNPVDVLSCLRICLWSELKKINRWTEQFDQFYKVLYKSFALYPSNMPQIFWEHVLILVLK